MSKKIQEKTSTKVAPTRSKEYQLLDSAWYKREALEAAIKKMPEWHNFQSAIAECREHDAEPSFARDWERLLHVIKG